jgi:TusE/DsrC/DsvC family sulfur relay protein
MTIKTIAGKNIEVDEAGYMTNLSQWDSNIAVALAKEAGINMTDKHWAVIEYIQNEFKKGNPLTIRKITKSGVADTKEFYALFPEGPLKKASFIAGIPKPVSCV